MKKYALFLSASLLLPVAAFATGIPVVDEQADQLLQQTVGKVDQVKTATQQVATTTDKIYQSVGAQSAHQTIDMSSYTKQLTALKQLVMQITQQPTASMTGTNSSSGSTSSGSGSNTAGITGQTACVTASGSSNSSGSTMTPQQAVASVKNLFYTTDNPPSQQVQALLTGVRRCAANTAAINGYAIAQQVQQITASMDQDLTTLATAASQSNNLIADGDVAAKISLLNQYRLDLLVILQTANLALASANTIAADPVFVSY